MKTLFFLIKSIALILMATALLDLAYYTLLDLDINFSAIGGLSHLILIKVDNFLGFIPDIWFEKKTITLDYKVISIFKNWWKADVAIFAFGYAVAYSVDFLKGLIYSKPSASAKKKEVSIN